MHSAPERGQVLALFVFGLVGFLAAVAVVVDGGFAFAQQRISQNGSDAAAHAGAIVLAERLVGNSPTDAQVLQAVNGVLTSMEMDVSRSRAVYTDIHGDPIGSTVGAFGGFSPPAAAWGVAVTGDKPFDTFFARAIGQDHWNAVTEATAVTGYAQNANGPFLPFTPPVNIVIDCENDGDPIWEDPNPGEDGNPWETGETYVIPLCSSGPGNVGWLDFAPPSGGTSELIEAIYPGRVNPPFESVPTWEWMVEPGNAAAGGIEDALRMYNGMTVLIPIYDATCDVMPATPESPCPADPGHGTPMVYHFPTIAAFELCGTEADGVTPLDYCQNVTAGEGRNTNSYQHGAYMSGASTTRQCDMNKPGTACLVGRFVDFIGPGEVGDLVVENPSPSSVVSVQLIK
jgi:hypothetical protein